jgi:uncharacterized membrane protein (UPF0127 family)
LNNILAVSVFSVLLLSSVASASKAPATQILSIDADKGATTFQVEVVREEKDRNRGLMFRKHMATDHGMLFDYDPPVDIAFWMKNTIIPLDIIFIGADGRIIRIAENTTPFSLAHIPSGGPARGVLEINGGLSAKLGIGPGDVVHHSLFQNAK